MKKRTQLAFDINPELKMEIKILAAKRNISQNLLMERALVAYIRQEKKYDLKTK